MHKKINKLILCSLILLLIFPIRSFSVSNTNVRKNSESGYTYRIEDNADLFNQREEDSLYSVLEEISYYAHACLVTLYRDEYGNSETYANKYLLKNFGDDVNAVILLIDMDTRNITVWADGQIRRTVEPKGTTITDNIYSYASDGEYAECAMEGLSEIKTVLDGNRIAQPMKYLSNICLSVLLALIIAYFVAKISSSTFKASDSETLKSIFSKFKVDDARTAFIFSTKEYSPRSSSGGGGSGGGGGGGGGGGSHGF